MAKARTWMFGFIAGVEACGQPIAGELKVVRDESKRLDAQGFLEIMDLLGREITCYQAAGDYLNEKSSRTLLREAESEAERLGYLAEVNAARILSSFYGV
jgi:hypothetical protein